MYFPSPINFFFSNHFLGDIYSSYNVNSLSKPVSPPLSKSWWSTRKQVYLLLYQLHLLLNSSVGELLLPCCIFLSSETHMVIALSTELWSQGFSLVPPGTVPLPPPLSAPLSLYLRTPRPHQWPLPPGRLQLSPSASLNLPVSSRIPQWSSSLTLSAAPCPLAIPWCLEDTTGRDIGSSLRERSGGNITFNTLSINPPPPHALQRY